MKTSVIGMGEVGSALYSILKEKYEINWYDKDSNPEGFCDIMHISIPWTDKFNSIVLQYIALQSPKYVVIHSSVPVGTTESLKPVTSDKIHIFHSPIRGKHPNMEIGIRTYVKYVSFDDNFYEGEKVCQYFESCGIVTKLIDGTKRTELMKLLELSRYGVYIAFAKEQERICESFGLNYHDIVPDYERTRSEGLEVLGLEDLKQPVLYPFKDFVGGHCTVEDMELLLDQKDFPLLRVAYEIDRNTKVWGNCNIYKTAKIGKGCSIGSGTEIGNNVIIGNNVRIGAMCFIPEGVTIEDNCFIAPCTKFSNDKHPPSKDKSKWGKILVRKGAVIGMGATVLPGVVIGENAIIGAGAVVTKSVPNGEMWYGVPAMPHGDRVYEKA